MGKVALLAIAIFSVIGTMTGFNQKQSMLDASNSVAEHQYEVVARNVSVTGYNAAKQALSESFTSRTITGDFSGGKYKAVITVSGDKATIESVGVIEDSNKEGVGYTVKAEYERTSSTIPSEPPAFMKYALVTDADLHMNGSILGEILVTGDARASLNANMHTNKNLHIDGTSVNVKGFGTFVGSGTSNPGHGLQNAFQPNHNPASLDGARQTKAVTIPDYDSAKYVSEVTPDKTESGDVTLSGDMSLGGTRENPYVWHIKGNLYATGNTKIDGYVMFIVDGNVDFNGNVKVGHSGYDGPDESSVAFYTGGNVELGGNTEVYGQIFAGGNVVFMHGTPKVFGSITTLGKADFRGTPKVYYREASPALTTIWEKVDEQIEMLAYSEW